MQNTLQRYSTIGFIVITMFLTLLTIMSFTSQKASASAPSGLPAVVATTTNPTLTGGTAAALMATSTCAARTITTSASAIMLTFSDYAGQTPTGSFGHLQAASTTATYDSGQIGCGLMKGYSFTTQVITVTEAR